MTIEVEEILTSLKNKLKPERYHHTIGVMFTAANLAYAYGFDADKAILAGALHDCAKLAESIDYIDECKRAGIEVPTFCYDNPALLHADLGAVYAKEQYHIEDEEILHAIRVHTTGCSNMSMLDKILYLADYIEPGRYPYDGIEQLRHTAYKDLDYAVLLESENVLSYLKARGCVTDPRTQETYEYYKAVIESRW
ncbi:MAG: HD domain-containing protein [Lachnospiraceae bacterium]|jgi:predicted HD superfamily hydrolase involved in NAD metabolism|nr:HD domain-containing protein [Lachnospiraceae bacterium]